MLKQSVSLLNVLERYGLLARLHRSGSALNGACPIHRGHNPTQFRADLQRNLWCCFGDCQGGGSIVDFVSRMERIGIREAGLLIQSWFGLLGGDQCPPQAPVLREQPAANPRLRSVLADLDPSHPYLQERGLGPETVSHFGLGYCREGWMKGWIAIPIHNAQGQLVAYASRWPGNPPGNQPRYRLPRGFHKSLELFNLHQALAEPASTPLIVVEGFFGCMRVWQAGFRKVAALMGSHLSDAQAGRLAAMTGEIVLMLDVDDAGHRGTQLALTRLQPHVPVRVVDVGRSGRQPEELSPEQLQTLLQR